MKDFKEQIEKLANEEVSNQIFHEALTKVYNYLNQRKTNNQWDKTDNFALETFGGLATKYVENPSSITFDALILAQSTLEKNVLSELKTQTENEIDLRNNHSKVFKFFASIFTQIGMAVLLGAGIGIAACIFAGAGWFFPVALALLGPALIVIARAEELRHGNSEVNKETQQKEIGFWKQAEPIQEAFAAMKENSLPSMK